VRNGADLAANVVVEAVERVGVDEAVAYPAASLHRLIYFVHNLTSEKKQLISNWTTLLERKV